MEYTIRVIATNLISGLVTVSAGSQHEALAKAKKLISPRLKHEGYEFQLGILRPDDSASDGRIEAQRGR